MAGPPLRAAELNDDLYLLTLRSNDDPYQTQYFTRRSIQILQDLIAEDLNADLEDLPLEAVDLAELGARPEDGGRLEPARDQIGTSLINLFSRTVLAYHFCTLF